DRAGPAEAVLRSDRASRRARLRRRELQGAVRGDRARTGFAREPLTAGVLDSALRQAASLERLEHRPWPVPQRPWTMGQTWEDLLFAHWRGDPELLGPRIPEGLERDRLEGAAGSGGGGVRSPTRGGRVRARVRAAS